MIAPPKILIALDAAVRELLAHKFRSLLATLGIVLGVSSLTSTLALTAGIERGIKTTIQTLGGLQRVEINNRPIENPLLNQAKLSPSLNAADTLLLRSAKPYISHVSAELRSHLPISSQFTSEATMRVQGINPDAFYIENLSLSAGRFLSGLDEVNTSRVVVIGSSIANRFFPKLSTDKILGKILFIKQKPYVVIGVLSYYEREIDRVRRQRGLLVPQRQRFRWDPYRLKNESILIPFSTMFYDFQSSKYPRHSPLTVPLDSITFRVKDLDLFRPTLAVAQRLLLQLRYGVENFEFITRQEMITAMESSLRATRLSGSLIAAISLIVGGIGITNIMLAGISERIREFGIRMAIGAKPSDIFLQLLTESLLISVLGATLGIAASLLLMDFLVFLAPSENSPILTFNSILIACLFALITGTLAGIYPAIRAAQLHPAEALRWE
ncbi:MAG: ABC transporter permease [Chthoniobacterales bacterium]|nr:ABC transporter permease [Chthoniobacterales bacterium]